MDFDYKTAAVDTTFTPPGLPLLVAVFLALFVGLFVGWGPTGADAIPQTQLPPEPLARDLRSERSYP
jgi:hypothetical protein